MDEKQVREGKVDTYSIVIKAHMDKKVPSLEPGRYSEEFCELVSYCLKFDKNERPKYDKPPIMGGKAKPPLASHPVIVKYRLEADKIDISRWLDSIEARIEEQSVAELGQGQSLSAAAAMAAEAATAEASTMTAVEESYAN